jgi:thiosulfate/3-mercaptopyruvate sulfurtransferase
MAFLLSAVLAVFAAAQAGPASPARISQAEFKALLASKSVAAIDVRREQDFRDGHIPGAVSLPLAGFLEDPGRYAAAVDRLRASKYPLVAYCACSGDTSSFRLAGLLQERGVTDVRVLTGGWADWVNAGNRVEKR